MALCPAAGEAQENAQGTWKSCTDARRTPASRRAGVIGSVPITPAFCANKIPRLTGGFLELWNCLRAIQDFYTAIACLKTLWLFLYPLANRIEPSERLLQSRPPKRRWRARAREKPRLTLWEGGGAERAALSSRTASSIMAAWASRASSPRRGTGEY